MVYRILCDAPNVFWFSYNIYKLGGTFPTRTAAWATGLRDKSGIRSNEKKNQDRRRRDKVRFIVSYVYISRSCNNNNNNYSNKNNNNNNNDDNRDTRAYYAHSTSSYNYDDRGCRRTHTRTCINIYVRACRHAYVQATAYLVYAVLSINHCRLRRKPRTGSSYAVVQSFSNIVSLYTPMRLYNIIIM